jgi:hypothetical protein
MSDVDRGYPAAWDGIRSVTQVIAAAGLAGDASKYYTDWHRDRGSYAHEAIRLHEEGDLDIDSLDPQLRPYLDAWLNFKADTNWLTAGGEKCYAHSVYGFKGKPDVYGLLHGNLDLIDLKMGVPASWHTVQLSAYQELLRHNGIQIVSSWPLYLQANGKYKMGSRRASREDFAIFINALNHKGEV